MTAGAGNDTIEGNAGEDTFVLGTNLTSADTIDGGEGADDLQFTDSGLATSDLDRVTNIETVTLGDAATSVTTKDSLVAGGQTLTVNTFNLSGTNSLIWDGSAEADGSFNITGSDQADTVTGGAGADVLSGGAGADTLTAGSGDDIISGGADADTIILGGNLTSADIIDGCLLYTSDAADE